jgi:ankyrin repeat protein
MFISIGGIFYQLSGMIPFVFNRSFRDNYENSTYIKQAILKNTAIDASDELVDKIFDFQERCLDGNIDGVKKIVPELKTHNSLLINTPLVFCKNQTVLHAVAIAGNTELLLYLLDQGVDINFSDDNGHTSLHHAVLAIRPDIVSELLERGAIADRTDNKSKTPLDIAKERRELYSKSKKGLQNVVARHDKMIVLLLNYINQKNSSDIAVK